MKQIRLILIMVLGVVVSQIANAQLVLTEPFAGYATGLLGSPGTGDTGEIPGWNTARPGITVTNGEGSLIGTNLGLIASVGDMVNILDTAGTNADSAGTNALFDVQSGVPNGCYNKFANKTSPYPAFTTTNAAVLYSSFLYRFKDNVNFYSNGVSLIADMNQESGGIQSGADSYWMLFGRTNANGTIQVGIAKDVPPVATVAGFVGATNWDPTILTVGQTFFVVVREQIFASNATATALGEEDDLWIDPPPTSFGTNEANVPAPDVSSPVSDGTNDVSSTGPGRFFIVDNGPTANLDELRIDTNWANVTPPFGQCVPAEFTVNPSNITQCAEINCRLIADGGYSTSPAFQWQLNRNGDSTWSNISGAYQSEYDTPNLQLASDNGNEYRCIDYVACDNSSATSSVATVTLTAPTVTPPGLILDDNWSSEIRYSPPPVSTNHSVWWTAVTADLDADPSDNGAWNGYTGMFSTQISNSSSLYLGYYVDETTTNLPIDLAIGTTLTVTMDFIPLGFENYTTNKPLNFGLYDYADGGVYVTADGANLTGSLGNGEGVRGYMLALDFGTNFSMATPMSLETRTGYGDNDLMSSSGDYLTFGSGPPNGAYAGTTAFQNGTNYTLTLSVTRAATNTSVVAATITGGGLNLSYAGVDTNYYGYHRFDSIGIQDNSQYNTCDYFDFTNLNVQVTEAVPVTPIPLSESKPSATNVVLSWANPLFTLQSASQVQGPYSFVPMAVSPYTNTITGSNQFFRIMGPPYAP